MAVQNLTGQLTLMEIAQREHAGTLLPIVNVISKVNEILLDAQWTEANNGTSRKGSRQSTEPTGTERDYSEGIDPESGTVEPFEEPTCMLDGLSKVDAALLQHSVAPLQERLDRDQMYLRGMAKTFASRLFTGDRSTYPKQINGFGTRAKWNALGTGYVYDNAGGNASATANKSDIWVIGWGVGKVRLIYPRNDMLGNAMPSDTPPVEGLGIRVQDFGKNLITDADGKEYPGYRTWLELHFGLMIEDYRYVRRVANISNTNIDNVDDFGFNEDYLIDALNDMQDLDGAAIYVPRAVRGQIWKRVKDKHNMLYSQDKDVFGRPMAMMNEVPIRLCETLSATGPQLT